MRSPTVPSPTHGKTSPRDESSRQPVRCLARGPCPGAEEHVAADGHGTRRIRGGTDPRRCGKSSGGCGSGSIEFSPKWGYAKRKSGGSRRGITVHGVADRIVQRSILNVLYTRRPALRKHLGEIPALLDVSTSFAGTPGRGVPEAVAAAVAACPARGARAFAAVGYQGLLSAGPEGRCRRSPEGSTLTTTSSPRCSKPPW